MDTFSLDDIRDSFVTDIDTCSSQIHDAFDDFEEDFPDGIQEILPDVSGLVRQCIRCLSQHARNHWPD